MILFRETNNQTWWLSLGIVGTLAFALLFSACSGQQQQEEAVQNSGEEEDDYSQGDSQGDQQMAEDGSQGDDLVTDEYSDEIDAMSAVEGTDDDQEMVELPVDSEDPMSMGEPSASDSGLSAGMGATSGIMSGTNTEPSSAALSSVRVLRHVAEDSGVFSGPDDAAQSVGNLEQGQPVLVIIEGEWGKITDTMYIPVSKLSDRPVPRSRKGNLWNSPAH
jgi:hypothetical protein